LEFVCECDVANGVENKKGVEIVAKSNFCNQFDGRDEIVVKLTFSL
jgi:hypothetical protein